MDFKDEDVYVVVSTDNDKELIDDFDCIIKKFLIKVYVFAVSAFFIYYLFSVPKIFLSIILIAPAIAVWIFYKNEKNDLYLYSSFHDFIHEKTELMDYAVKTRYARAIVDNQYSIKAIAVYVGLMFIGCVITFLLAQGIHMIVRGLNG